MDAIKSMSRGEIKNSPQKHEVINGHACGGGGGGWGRGGGGGF